jgi:hypothetical protein
VKKLHLLQNIHPLHATASYILKKMSNFSLPFSCNIFKQIFFKFCLYVVCILRKQHTFCQHGQIYIRRERNTFKKGNDQFRNWPSPYVTCNIYFKRLITPNISNYKFREPQIIHIFVFDNVLWWFGSYHCLSILPFILLN